MWFVCSLSLNNFPLIALYLSFIIICLILSFISNFPLLKHFFILIYMCTHRFFLYPNLFNRGINTLIFSNIYIYDVNQFRVKQADKEMCVYLSFGEHL